MINIKIITKYRKTISVILIILITLTFVIATPKTFTRQPKAVAITATTVALTIMSALMIYFGVTNYDEMGKYISNEGQFYSLVRKTAESLGWGALFGSNLGFAKNIFDIILDKINGQSYTKNVYNNLTETYDELEFIDVPINENLLDEIKVSEIPNKLYDSVYFNQARLTYNNAFTSNGGIMLQGGIEYPLNYIIEALNITGTDVINADRTISQRDNQTMNTYYQSNPYSVFNLEATTYVKGNASNYELFLFKTYHFPSTFYNNVQEQYRLNFNRSIYYETGELKSENSTLTVFPFKNNQSSIYSYTSNSISGNGYDVNLISFQFSRTTARSEFTNKHTGMTSILFNGDVALSNNITDLLNVNLEEVDISNKIIKTNTYNQVKEMSLPNVITIPVNSTTGTIDNDVIEKISAGIYAPTILTEASTGAIAMPDTIPYDTTWWDNLKSKIEAGISIPLTDLGQSISTAISQPLNSIYDKVAEIAESISTPATPPDGSGETPEETDGNYTDYKIWDMVFINFRILKAIALLGTRILVTLASFMAIAPDGSNIPDDMLIGVSYMKSLVITPINTTYWDMMTYIFMFMFGLMLIKLFNRNMKPVWTPSYNLSIGNEDELGYEAERGIDVNSITTKGINFFKMLK